MSEAKSASLVSDIAMEWVLYIEIISGHTKKSHLSFAHHATVSKKVQQNNEGQDNKVSASESY